uniref:Diphthine--ammonia ligase n=1 Tax=Caldiarchaeum subterraneum TaxID=311458 RepID=A0A7C5YBB9_CALS0
MKTIVSWSSGKDSCFTLHVLREMDVEVVGLLTTVKTGYRRVSMHGVREELVDLQALHLGLPLFKAFIPPNCRNEVYESIMRDTCLKLKELGVDAIAFGDIFLEDVRKYREKNLNAVGLKPLFPIWGRSTAELAETFLSLGYRAKVAVVDLEKLPKSFAGREFDRNFLKELPAEVDPCGENGEFHTFVYAGPLFSVPIKVEVGETVVRDNRFFYADLLPATA